MAAPLRGVPMTAGWPAALFCLLVAVCAPEIRAEDPTDPEKDGFDTLPIAGTVTMLRTNTAITNSSLCASIGKEGVLLVDASFPRLGPKLQATVRDLGGGPIRYIVSTHHHWDHVWGNEFFGAAGAVILAHDKLRVLLLNELLPDDSGRTLDARGLPAITIEGSLSLHVNGEEARLTAMPRGGHTGGDTVVYFAGSNVICAGDYYFAGKYPIIDVDAGGSLDGYVENCEWLLERHPPDARIVPGHGSFPPEPLRVHSMTEYREWVSILKDSIVHIRERKAAGLSIEQIQQEGLQERFAPLGARPRFVSEARWIEFVHGQSP